MKVYRNIPFIDQKGFSLKNFFHYQVAGKRRWLELPFIGFTWRILPLLLIAFTGCQKHIDKPVKVLQPVITTRITCLKWELVTKTIGQYTITHQQCAESRIDTFLIYQ